MTMRRKTKGTTIIEFVLTTALVLAPLLLGCMVIGFNLIRAIQANQVNRDAGHMFARGVDFSTSAGGAGNRAVLTYMAPRLADASTAGTGLVILSAIEFIGPDTCTNCANLNHAVFTRQLRIGNAALFQSSFGTVPSGSLLADGSGAVRNPLTDIAVRADRVLGVLTMNDGDVAYMSETYFSSTDFDLSGFLRNSGVYCRAIF